MSNKPQARSSNFKKRFQRLADSDKNADCEFLVGPRETLVKGHKLIFSSASEVFEAMFFGNLKETKQIVIEDLDPDGFRGMKTFIYTGEVCFTSTFHALSIYIATRKYLIEELTVECAEYIKNEIQPCEVLEFIDRCLTNVIDEFNELCCRIIREKTDEVLASEYFVSVSTQTIELILKSDALKINSEVELYGHFERWALAEIQRQKIPADRVLTKFNDLKKYFKFLTISSEDFVLKVAPSPLFTQDEKFEIALNKMKFDSKMTSNSLSMTLQPRNFINPLSNSENQHHLKYMFRFKLKNNRNHARHCGRQARKILELDNDLTQYTNNINIIPEQSELARRECELRVESLLHEGYLLFIAQSTDKRNRRVDFLTIIKTKFRVLAVNQCDDLFFENESRHIHCFEDVLCCVKTVLAVIPLSSVLQSDRFHRDYGPSHDCIEVEGTFDVQVMKYRFDVQKTVETEDSPHPLIQFDCGL